MAQIFVSHAHEDRAWARDLAVWLHDEGWTVWWDQDLLAGKSFRAAIEQELEAAKCVIVLWSRHSVKSHWVTDEAQLGAERNILVPVLLDDSTIPIGFRQIQAARLFEADWKGNDTNLDALRRSIGSIVGSPAARRHSSGRNTAKTPRTPVAVESDEALLEVPAALPRSKSLRWVLGIAVLTMSAGGMLAGWVVASRFTDNDLLLSGAAGIGGMLAVWLLTVAFPSLRHPVE